MLILLIALALFFDFLNGLRDSANMVATVISSRALRPRAALLLTALGEFTGPFLFAKFLRFFTKYGPFSAGVIVGLLSSFMSIVFSG